MDVSAAPEESEVLAVIHGLYGENRHTLRRSLITWEPLRITIRKVWKS